MRADRRRPKQYSGAPACGHTGDSLAEIVDAELDCGDLEPFDRIDIKHNLGGVAGGERAGSARRNQNCEWCARAAVEQSASLVEVRHRKNGNGGLLIERGDDRLGSGAVILVNQWNPIGVGANQRAVNVAERKPGDRNYDDGGEQQHEEAHAVSHQEAELIQEREEDGAQHRSNLIEAAQCASGTWSRSTCPVRAMKASERFGLCTLNSRI